MNPVGTVRFLFVARPALWSLARNTVFVDEAGNLFWHPGWLWRYTHVPLAAWLPVRHLPPGSLGLRADQIKDCRLTSAVFPFAPTGLSITYVDDAGPGRMTLIPADRIGGWQVRLARSGAAWAPPVLDSVARVTVRRSLSLAIVFAPIAAAGWVIHRFGDNRVAFALALAGGILWYFGSIVVTLLGLSRRSGRPLPLVDPPGVTGGWPDPNRS